MAAYMKNIWSVDLEASADPYGEGTGYEVLVRAETRQEARRKANLYAKENYPGYKAFKLRPAPKAVLD